MPESIRRSPSQTLSEPETNPETPSQTVTAPQALPEPKTLLAELLFALEALIPADTIREIKAQLAPHSGLRRIPACA